MAAAAHPSPRGLKLFPSEPCSLCGGCVLGAEHCHEEPPCCVPCSQWSSADFYQDSETNLELLLAIARNNEFDDSSWEPPDEDEGSDTGNSEAHSSTTASCSESCRAPPPLPVSHRSSYRKVQRLNRQIVPGTPVPLQSELWIRWCDLPRLLVADGDGAFCSFGAKLGHFETLLVALDSAVALGIVLVYVAARKTYRLLSGPTLEVKQIAFAHGLHHVRSYPYHTTCFAIYGRGDNRRVQVWQADRNCSFSPKRLESLHESSFRLLSAISETFLFVRTGCEHTCDYQ